MMPQKRVLVVGAGLAGLSCAVRLQQKGVECQVLEKSECTGGKVRTHVVDGYRLDRGFQVLLSAYPRSQQILDYGALELKSFHPGARIWLNGKFHTLGDPSRRPSDALSTLLAPVGSLSDKLRILDLRSRVCEDSVAHLMARPEVTTERRLREFGFSAKMAHQFFRPFLGGIFLEPNLVTSSRKFEFVMRMFSQGEAVLPKLGMQAIPQQLANRLRSGTLQMSCKVESVADGSVVLASGEHRQADAVVLATPQLEAARLLTRSQNVRSAAVTCLYYAADTPPVKGPWLLLNGEGKGPINNFCVPTELHASYAPAGKSLISATVLGLASDEQALEQQVRAQLREWFGGTTRSWRHLRTYSIPEALTLQEPPALQVVRKPLQISRRLFACCDYLSIASIEGAIATGMRCADEVCAALMVF